MKTFEIKNNNNCIKISKVIFGTSYIGNMERHQDAYDQMNRYFELGGRCIDTARMYSNLSPDDKCPSEKVIGDWMKHTGIRKELIISTKGGHPPLGQMQVNRLGRNDLWFDLEQSLDALQTDYVDMYWLHRDNKNATVEQVIDTLNEFVDKGLVRCFGVSNWTTQRLIEANQYAQRVGKLGFSASQIQWSLAGCTPETLEDDTLVCMNDNIHADYIKYKIPVMAFNAQAKGLFSKLAVMSTDQLPIKIRQRFLNEEFRDENLNRFNRLMQLCEKYNVSPAVVAIGYLTNQTLPTGAIIGCSNMAQLEDSMNAQDFVLTPQEIEWLEGK